MDEGVIVYLFMTFPSVLVLEESWRSSVEHSCDLV